MTKQSLTALMAPAATAATALRPSSFNKQRCGLPEFGWKRIPCTAVSTSCSSSVCSGRPAPARRGVVRSISFDEDIEVQSIPRLPRHDVDDLFYDEDQIAKFRNDAFMEKCGLDPADF